MNHPFDFVGILHPMTVHFPIALILTTIALALWCVYKNHSLKMKKYIKILAVISAISAWAAVGTGGLTPNYTGNINIVEGFHHIAAITSSILISISALIYLFSNYLFEYAIWRWLAFIFLCLAGIAVGIAGYFGGYIVYNMLL